MRTWCAGAAIAALLCLFVPAMMPAFASEITLLYTGETHAMLYPCSCPIETDGGIARRATLVRDMRKSMPNVLLVDSGAFFAGGLMDEYTQSTELDMARTRINIDAMDRMGYDAVAIGDEEFNFGRQFFEDSLDKRRSAFVSANIESDRVVPFVIKSFPDVKVGIVGATPLSARPKSGGIGVTDPKEAVARAVMKAKASGADIVVLISHLGETDDMELLKAVDGIDVVVIGNGRSKQELFSKEGSTLLLRPSWQGRRMGKAVLSVKNGKVADVRVEEVRLSDKIADDASVASLGPQCFMDSNCKKGSRKGTCQEPGTKNARCVFPKDVKIPLTVILPRNCLTCQVDKTLEAFSRQFPGIEVTRMTYPGAQAEKLIKELSIKTLPVFVFGNTLAQDPGYAEVKDRFDAINGRYVLKPQFGGVAVFLDRPYEANRLDVFLSLYDPNITVLLDRLEEFDPQIHFLAARKDGQLVAAKGIGELEEMKRCACVNKYYPAYYWNYLNCRVRHIESSWWQDCLGDLDPAPITACAKGAEGTALVEQNIAMNESMQIMTSPTYVVNNQNIFSSEQPPSKEEFRKIFTAK